MLKNLCLLWALVAQSSNVVAVPLLANGLSEIRHIAGDEHVVLVDKSQTDGHTVLTRLDLHPSHPDVLYTWNNSAFQGFAARMAPHCLTALANMTDVLHVERTMRVHSHTTTVRASSPWGLQRMSSTGVLFGNPQSLTYAYTYGAPSLGTGVDIYSVDTGINTANTIFTGRASMGWSFESDETDHVGHGTHVAGTAGGAIFGVASSANIIGVKALGDDGSGSSTNSIAALDWVVTAHMKRRGQPGFVGSVMSLSWGLETLSPAIQTAVGAALDVGVHVSIAAGNAAGDACTTSPAASGGANSAALVVGSIDEASTISSFSNTGRCVDVYAPGEDVLSAWIGGTNVLNYLSGTSMACPHVSGLIAYLMAGNATLAASPAAMKQEILNMALTGTLKGRALPGDQGRLLNNGMKGTVAGESAATLE